MILVVVIAIISSINISTRMSCYISIGISIRIFVLD